MRQKKYTSLTEMTGMAAATKMGEYFLKTKYGEEQR